MEQLLIFYQSIVIRFHRRELKSCIRFGIQSIAVFRFGSCIVFVFFTVVRQSSDHDKLRPSKAYLPDWKSLHGVLGNAAFLSLTCSTSYFAIMTALHKEVTTSHSVSPRRSWPRSMPGAFKLTQVHRVGIWPTCTTPCTRLEHYTSSSTVQAWSTAWLGFLTFLQPTQKVD